MSNYFPQLCKVGGKIFLTTKYTKSERLPQAIVIYLDKKLNQKTGGTALKDDLGILILCQT